jgi:hypothetical protein
MRGPLGEDVAEGAGPVRMERGLASVVTWVVLAVALYALARASLFAQMNTVVVPDSASYLPDPNDPWARVSLVGGDRPGFVVQALYALVRRQDVAVVAQLLLSITSWLTLAAVVYRSLRKNVWTAVTAALVVVLFSLLPPVVMWDRMLLTESVSLSAAVLWLSAVTTVWRRSSGTSAAALAVASSLAVATRPQNIVVVLPVTLASLGWTLFRRHGATAQARPLIVLSCAVIVAALPWSLWVTERSAAVWRDFLNQTRTIYYADSDDYFEFLLSRGMPRCPYLREVAQSLSGTLETDSWDASFAAWRAAEPQLESQCPGIIAWIRAESPQPIDLLAEPRIVVRILLEDLTFAIRGVDPYTPDNEFLVQLDVPPYLGGVYGTVFASGLAGTVTCLAMGTGIMGALAARRHRRAPLLAAGVVVGVAIALFGTFVVLAATADGGELDRHSLPWSTLLPLVLLVAPTLVLELTDAAPMSFDRRARSGPFYGGQSKIPVGGHVTSLPADS